MVLAGPLKWLQYVLIILNFLTMLAGADAVYLGVWTLISKYGSDMMSNLTDSIIYRLLSILTTVGGVCILIIAIVGFRCILTDGSRSMTAHFISTLLMLLFFVTITIIGLLNTNSLQDKLSTQMEKTLTYSYNNKEDITKQWDTMQQELHCCGIKGNITDNPPWILWKNSSWFQNQEDKVQYFPESCCDKTFFTNKCGTLDDATDQKENRSFYDFSQEYPALFTTGCLNKLIDKITEKGRYICISFAAILVLLFLCTILSITLLIIIAHLEKKRHGGYA
ncbi:hypothetical protein BsWGS_02296 [Bradybaena similaris]